MRWITNKISRYDAKVSRGTSMSYIISLFDDVHAIFFIFVIPEVLLKKLCIIM